MIFEMEHSALGIIRQIGIPVRLSNTPGAVRTLPCKTGQDTVELLGWGIHHGNRVIEKE